MVERSRRIELRVTEDELMKIRDRMEEAGISSLTAYLVRMAIHGYVIVMDLSDLKEILRLLQISGNNLNQYARKANETGSIYHEDIEELKNNQKEILQEMRNVLDRLTAIM
jgi:mobilization protein